MYRLLNPELAHGSKQPSVAVGCLGFQEAEPLCFPNRQLPVSEMRTPRPRVERRPWAKGSNQIFGKPWTLHRLRPSLEVFPPRRNPFYNAHPACLSLLSNGTCLTVGQLQKLHLLPVEICFILYLILDLGQHCELCCGRDNAIDFPFDVTFQ